MLMVDLSGEEALGSASAAVVERSSVLCTFSVYPFFKNCSPKGRHLLHRLLGFYM